MNAVLRACAIRPYRTGDEPDIVRQANDREVWINLRDRFPHPYLPADAHAWVRHVTAQKPLTHFAITVSDRVVGGIGFDFLPDVHRKSAEIGYWLGRAAWGKGIATEALVAVTEHAFATYDVARLFAGVFAWNPASARVLEKAGYTFEGRLRAAVYKDDRLVDQLLYARVRT